MTDLIQQASDLFSEEIDAFAGTYQDLKDYINGKPVHTPASKWAKRAITAATTVIPVGLSLKAAGKSAKIAGKTVKQYSHLSKTKREASKAAHADELQRLRKEKEHLQRTSHTAKEVGRQVRRTAKLVYHATGDNDARKRRNAVAYDIAVYADNPQEVKKMAARKRKLISEKMKKDAIGGAADAAIKQLSSKNYKKKPIQADDLKILGAQMALGALKGARGLKRGGFGQRKNDKHWYTKLGTDLVGLNFAAVDKLGWRDDALLSPVGNSDKLRVTTDAVVNLMLTIPSGADEPFTVAAAKLANEMRLHSGANTIYTPADIMEYLIEARSIMAGICQARRVLMSLNNAEPTDVDAYKKYTLMALGAFSATARNYYQYTAKEAANALTDLNSLIKAVRMMIPINMPIMKRTEWLFSNAFADGRTAKHGVKMFIATTLPKATINPETEVITVTQENFLNDELLKILIALRHRVNTFVVKQKHMAIAGDIMKVYGAAAFWSPALLTGEEAMPILYDEEALTQIQNMSVLSSPCVKISATDSTQVIQDGEVTTAIKFEATGQDADFRLGRAYVRNQRKVVQTYKSSPDAGDILELTRLTAFVDFDDPGNNSSIFSKTVVCGTEIVDSYGYVMDRFDAASGDYLTLLYEHEIASDRQALLFASCWSIDDWAPLIILDYNPSTHEVVAMFDFETWASLSTAQMKSFHYIAGLSLYTNETPVLRPTI